MHGFTDYASNTKMINFSKILSEEQGLNALPASTNTLSFLSGLKKEVVALKGTYIAIITGRDFK